MHDNYTAAHLERVAPFDLGHQMAVQQVAPLVRLEGPQLAESWQGLSAPQCS